MTDEIPAMPPHHFSSGDGVAELRRDGPAPLVAGALLTPRQHDCLAWVRHGKSSNDIGELLGISPHTVEEHVAQACRKLGVRTRVQAVVEASLLGLI